MTLFREITLIDYSRDLKTRKDARRYVGPYRWTPAKPNTGRGFYMDSTCSAVDARGSTFDLRIMPASFYLKSFNVLGRLSGFYADDDGFTIIRPIVMRLNHGRGFLAGWTMGAGMCGTVSATIWADSQDAAIAAYEEAERAADAEREYQAQQEAYAA